MQNQDMNQHKMDERTIISHLNQMSKNMLRLKILITTLTEEMERQGFVITSEILETADIKYEETLNKVENKIKDELDKLKNEFIISNLFNGQTGEA